MQVHVGTSGFAYKEWIGTLYPAGTRTQDMLARYAAQLDAVEINASFYRFPSVAGLAAWAAQVPESFRFAIKVPQRITHVMRLRGVQAEVTRLIDTVTTLGQRLGPVLFLLPPRMPVNLETLRELISRLPPTMQFAFEFRDSAWLCEPVYEMLAAHGCALCFDDASMPAPIGTADWGYVRLRREHYDDTALAEAANQVLNQPWREAYVFIKHKTPDSPLLARKWRATVTRHSAPL